MLKMDLYDNGNEHCWLTTKQLGMPTAKAGVSGFVINILKMFLIFPITGNVLSTCQEKSSHIAHERTSWDILVY